MSKKTTEIQEIKNFLDGLNSKYTRLHKKYEDLFWISYMGDHSINDEMNKALGKKNAFNTDRKLSQKVEEFLAVAGPKEKKRLKAWKKFFETCQTPLGLVELRDKIAEVETDVVSRRANRKEGYIDPKTKKFVESSKRQMVFMRMTHDDEKIRKACFEAIEKLSLDFVDDFIKYVGLKNEYARALGYEDFYAYKVYVEEGMTKKEVFDVFDSVYEKTKYAFEDIRKMEKKMPGLRKPWNFSYMLAGDFVKEEDPYFQIEDSLIRWGKSFSAMGLNYRGGKLQLDLLVRKGKYNNGFCHWPDVVKYKGEKRFPGSANFTSNAVCGQVGSGKDAMETLFHEGAHAAHILGSEETEACFNIEYPPLSTAWAETQSMLMEAIPGSIEWRMRYAKNKEGDSYPFSSYRKRVEKLSPVAPLRMMSIMCVAEFEKEIYECKNLNAEKVIKIAKKVYKKYNDMSCDSVNVLDIPHFFAWDSSCSYHGYGLAELAVCQWVDCFYKKYGYIIDNPKVGKDMTKVWKLAASKTFKDFIKLATGKKLSSKAYVDSVTRSVEDTMKRAKKRLKAMEKVSLYTKPVNLNASIKMVHGKKVIADNKKSFEHMAETYKKWLKKQ